MSLCVALLALAAGAEGAERWVGCAEEGGVCRFDGLRRVAFGAGNKWMYRSHENAATCNAASFGGDPAPNVRKRCRFLVAPDPIGYLPAPPHWVQCAKEGETCRVHGKLKVAYGVGSSWVADTFATNIECSNGVFGDPAPGKAKTCRVLASATGGTGTPLPAAPEALPAKWIGCATEGRFCAFDGRRRVAFGAGKRWNTGVFVNGVDCTREKFGDPAPGERKECRFDANSR